MSHDTSLKSAEALVEQVEFGSRRPAGAVANALFAVALLWSLFQLWIASPIPFAINVGIFNATEARAIHLAFALFLAFTLFPARERSPRHRIPLTDWMMAAVAAVSAAYLYLFQDALAQRPGAPTTLDLLVGTVGILLLLEAARRTLGKPLMVVALVFLLYTFGGAYMPDLIAHKGQSLSKVVSHQWLTTEGIFGIALGVSTSFVFLFVLFGAMLEKASAGHYFIQVAFSLLGHMRGGPAKAAVVASAATGLISGSSIANVATTGTFTIPLMKRVGFSPEKAGAVEVAGSTNGQLTPPVMGAAAFLMIEYVGISYLEVIKHALLPALISYIALVYIVHLEALKAGMQGLPRRYVPGWKERLLGWLGILIGVCLTGLAVYYGIGWVKQLAGEYALPIVSLLVALVYVALVKYAARFPELAMDDPDEPITELPAIGPTLKVGIYFLLPVVVLMWCLIVERFSPGLAAFWATAFMTFIVVTQRPLLARFRKQVSSGLWQHGWRDLIDALVLGARSMIGIGIATATAGIVVGTITLTGIGQVMVELVEFLSGGSLLAALLLTAAICIVLGMGLPTTANYIVVSSLMAPVVVAMASAHGLVVPLIAVHMFVFYFGILADDTPPVGLAAFAASAIAKSDPIKTGIQGFAYDIRTAILPFLFIFNNQLLLIGIDGWFELLVVVVTAVGAMLLFAAALQGYWLTRSRWWETLALLLVAFTLFRPGFWWDELYPPTQSHPGAAIERFAATQPPNEPLIVRVSGIDIDGDEVSKTVMLPLPKGDSGRQRLAETGIEVRLEAGRAFVEQVEFGSTAQSLGIDFDWEVEQIEVPSERPPKQWMYVPALLLLLLVGWRQRQRRMSPSLVS